MSHVTASRRIAVTLFVIGCLFFPMSIGYTQWRATQAREALCAKGNETRAAVLDVFHLIRDFPRPDDRPPLTEEQQKISDMFWQDVEEALAPIHCT
jgi:hypothetical protein